MAAKIHGNTKVKMLRKPDRIELEWTYEPKDYFETSYASSTADFKMAVSDGRVLVVVNELLRFSDDLIDQATVQIEGIFLTRQLQLHKLHTLAGPTINLHRGDKKDVIIGRAYGRQCPRSRGFSRCGCKG